MGGALVLVVGPSGSGKDTLINAAREQLGHEERFHFVRRLVTREAVAELEAHDCISWPEFNAGRNGDAFSLSWEAHGLGYALPGDLDHRLATGHIVVANVSRGVVALAMARYPTVHVLQIDADHEVRAQRLLARSREEPHEVEARLAREEIALPAGTPSRVVDNSGTVEAGVRSFVQSLRAIAGEMGR